MLAGPGRLERTHSAPAILEGRSQEAADAEPLARGDRPLARAPSAPLLEATEPALEDPPRKAPSVRARDLARDAARREVETRFGVAYNQPPVDPDLTAATIEGHAKAGSGGLGFSSEHLSGYAHGGYVGLDATTGTGPGISASAMPGFASVGPSLAVSGAPGGLSTVVPYLGGYPGYMGPGVALVFDTTLGRVGAGVFVWGGAHGALWLEPPPNPDPAPETMRRAYYRQHVRHGVLLTGGFRPHAIGIGGLFSFTRSAKLELKTQVAQRDIAALEAYRDKKFPFFRDVGLLLGISKSPITIPDLRVPLESMKEGDELRTSVRGTYTLGINADAVLRAGLTASLTGDFDLGVRRVDAHRVSVTLAPKAGAVLSGDLQIPFLRGALSRDHADMLSQEMIFDCRPDVGDGLAQYLAVIEHGRLPTDVASLKETLRGAEEVILARHARETGLPEGVERGVTGRAQRTAHRLGWDVGLVVAPLHGGSRVRFKEALVVAGGDRADRVDGSGVSRMRERFRTVRSEDQARSELRQSTQLVEGAPKKTFAGFQLELRFQRASATGADRRQIAKRLEAGLGVKSAAYPEGEDLFRGPMSIRATRPVSPESILGLRVDEPRIHEVARALSLSPRALEACIRDATQQVVPEAPERLPPEVLNALLRSRITPLQEFVRVQGERGLAALDRLLPRAEGLSPTVTLANARADHLIEKGKNLLARIPAPDEARAPLPKALARRIERFHRKVDAEVVELMGDGVRQAQDSAGTLEKALELAAIDAAVARRAAPPQPVPGDEAAATPRPEWVPQ